jgi:chromosome segregation ATPase
VLSLTSACCVPFFCLFPEPDEYLLGLLSTACTRYVEEASGWNLCRHSEKQRSAAAEESRLQADLQTLRTEAASTARLVQDLEARASHGDAAVAEVESLRAEAAATATSLAVTQRKLKESEHALQCARDELEMVQDRVCAALNC